MPLLLAPENGVKFCNTDTFSPRAAYSAFLRVLRRFATIVEQCASVLRSIASCA